MLRRTVLLIGGVLLAFCYAVFCIFATDRVFPMIMTMANLTPADPMYVALPYLEVLCGIILFIPFEYVGLAIISFFMGIITEDRPEWLT